jgi:hypothetical protein
MLCGNQPTLNATKNHLQHAHSHPTTIVKTKSFRDFTNDYACGPTNNYILFYELLLTNHMSYGPSNNSNKP